MENMYLMASLALFILAGCSNDRYEGPDVPGTKATIWANINCTQTRANNTEWTIHDQIGVTVGSGDPRSTNIPYEYSGTDGQPFNRISEKELYIKSQIDIPVTAYYPYSGAEGLDPEEIEINTQDQTAANQSKIDYMFAQTTASRTNPNISLLFFHKMSNLIFNFESEDPDANIGNLTYTLSGITIKGTFNTSTGEIFPEEATGEVSTQPTLNTTSSLFLIPQTKENIELEIAVGSVYYITTIENLNLKSGFAHTYKITLKNLNEAPYITISKGTISPWEPGEGGEIEAPEYKPGNDPIIEVPEWSGSENTNIETSPTE